jgi:outer membrane protein
MHDMSRTGWPWRQRRGVAFACLLACLVLLPPGASAETLFDALENAYLINPAMNAERARLRATDEEVARAMSGFRPTISGTGEADYLTQHGNIKGPGNDCIARDRNLKCILTSGQASANDGLNHPHGYGVQLSQNLFNGFQNLNAVRESKSNVQAGRENLRTIEQSILLDGVTAYVDVVRDTAVIRLRENNVEVLTEQLRQTKDRFDVGEVTRTDVAQAEARRADALSSLAVAQANLKTSRATYERIIGHPPSDLANPPSILHLLPSTLDESMTLGDGENPVILTSVYLEEASLYTVNRLVGELMPQITAEANYQRFFDISNFIEEQETTTFTARMTVPFYQGGAVAAGIRQAKEINHQRKKEVEDARLRVHADVVSNWGILQSSTAQIESAKAAVEANRIALAGVQEEEKVGQRTTLDVLNAQLEFLASQIQLVQALRDRIVAEYSLYAAIGRLDAQSLGLSVPYYDPIEHYDIVKNKFWGLRPPSPPTPDE